jgi:hypothetical protein
MSEISPEAIDAPTPTTEAAPDTTAATGKVFTQAELDTIVKERLERQKRALEAQQGKAAEEAQAAALKEQGDFRKLYEQEQSKAATLEAALKAKERAELLRKAAKAGGLDPDDDDLLSRLRGETEDELTDDAKKLAARLAPKATEPAQQRGTGTPRTIPATRPAAATGPTRPERPTVKF